jgi:hypothetical protein
MGYSLAVHPRVESYEEAKGQVVRCLSFALQGSEWRYSIGRRNPRRAHNERIWFMRRKEWFNMASERSQHEK